VLSANIVANLQPAGSLSHSKGFAGFPLRVVWADLRLLRSLRLWVLRDASGRNNRGQ
jgi:hypothetical protein